MMISGFENKDYRNGFDEGYEKGRADVIEEIIQAEKSKFFCIEDLCTGNKRCSDCRVEYLLKLKEDKK